MQAYPIHLPMRRGRSTLSVEAALRRFAHLTLHECSTTTGQAVAHYRTARRRRSGLGPP